jgi:hypothetical protein
MHPSDGNTAAIERHLAEQEAHDASQPLYCPACDETISGEYETCIYCGGELEETP